MSIKNKLRLPVGQSQFEYMDCNQSFTNRNLETNLY